MISLSKQTWNTRWNWIISTRWRCWCSITFHDISFARFLEEFLFGDFGIILRGGVTNRQHGPTSAPWLVNWGIVHRFGQTWHLKTWNCCLELSIYNVKYTHRSALCLYNVTVWTATRVMKHCETCLWDLCYKRSTTQAYKMFKATRIPNKQVCYITHPNAFVCIFKPNQPVLVISHAWWTIIKVPLTSKISKIKKVSEISLVYILYDKSLRAHLNPNSIDSLVVVAGTSYY